MARSRKKLLKMRARRAAKRTASPGLEISRRIRAGVTIMPSSGNVDKTVTTMDSIIARQTIAHRRRPYTPIARQVERRGSLISNLGTIASRGPTRGLFHGAERDTKRSSAQEFLSAAVLRRPSPLVSLDPRATRSSHRRQAYGARKGPSNARVASLAGAGYSSSAVVMASWILRRA